MCATFLTSCFFFSILFLLPLSFFFFFFNDTATTEIYTLSLHDALPICCALPCSWVPANNCEAVRFVSEKNVRDLFHQRGAVSLHTMRGIQNYQSPAIRQWPRASAAGPVVSASA